MSFMGEMNGNINSLDTEIRSRFTSSTQTSYGMICSSSANYRQKINENGNSVQLNCLCDNRLSDLINQIMRDEYFSSITEKHLSKLNIKTHHFSVDSLKDIHLMILNQLGSLKQSSDYEMLLKKLNAKTVIKLSIYLESSLLKFKLDLLLFSKCVI